MTVKKKFKVLTSLSTQYIWPSFTTFSNKCVTVRVLTIHLLGNFAKYSIKEVTMAINMVSVMTTSRQSGGGGSTQPEQTRRHIQRRVHSFSLNDTVTSVSFEAKANYLQLRTAVERQQRKLVSSNRF